jgi:alkylation response protein AidB-like acyl-CoA dehydrogenase
MAVTIDPALLAAAECDERGVPLAGRRAELAALRAAGAADLAAGRIYEGHVNALQLIGRLGTPAQRARARADAERGLLFGVWNTQDDDPVRVVDAGSRIALAGAKTWASGAGGTVLRPVVTARLPDGASQMCVVPLDELSAQVDASEWRPLGMQASDSFRVGFEGVTLAPDALLGGPGDYERAPWFLGGALRFCAVQCGGLEALLAATARYLSERGRDGDPFQTARVARMRVGVRASLGLLAAGADAWSAFDAEPSDRNAAAVVDAADVARVQVERAALDGIELAEQSVGARGLLEPLPFAALVRDLSMYLRQPAPDAALLRVGRTAFAEASSGRSTVSASFNGTSA